jgi:proline iminopeptidase
MLITIPARSKTEQTRLFVEIVESDTNAKNKPYLFILPGGPGAHSQHYQAYKALKVCTNLVFHDPRGCGKSDRGDPLSYTMDNYIEDIEEIRKQLQLTNIILLGKSYGGICAMGYALKYPQHLQKLIIAASAPSYQAMEMAKEKLATRGTPEQLRIVQKVWGGKFQNAEEIAEYFRIMAPLYSTKNQPLSADMEMAPFGFEALNLGFTTFLRTVDLTDSLANIQIPTLILAGEKDWVCDPYWSQLMAAKIPHSKLHLFTNASHLLEVDATEEYFKTIADFIEE